jgi:tetratricopeptide (TPR) repeat protein
MRTRFASALVLALSVAACGTQTDEANRTTLGGEPAQQGGGLPAEIQAPIDSGNVAYRARDYEAALRHYQVATSRSENEPTAWFGVAMAAEAMGNRALADSARSRINRLAPDLNVSGHTDASDTGHP